MYVAKWKGGTMSGYKQFNLLAQQEVGKQREFLYKTNRIYKASFYMFYIEYFT